MSKIKRKVVLHGPSTLTVSLPTKWIKKNGIKKGDELEVEEAGKKLTIYTEKEYSPIKKHRVDFSSLSDDAARTLISSLHKSGYDEIEIIFDNPQILKVLQERIQEMLIGYEIISQQASSCVIKSISSNESQEFENVLRRAFLVTVSMSKSSLEAIESENTDMLKDVTVLEQTNNRLTNFCHRIIHKQTQDMEKSHYYYVIIWLLESICDDYKQIINHVKSNGKTKIDKQTIQLFKKVNETLEKYYKLFYKFSFKDMDDVRKNATALREQVLKSINTDQKDVAVLIYLQSILQRILDALGSTTGIHL